MNAHMIKCVDARMVSINVDDADNMPIWRMYTMHTTGWLWPERVEIRWENRQLVRLAVYGKRVKKDGDVGNADTSTQFVQWGNVLAENPIPPWLAALVEEYAP